MWVFYWSLSNSKFTQVFRSLLIVLADLNTISDFQFLQSFSKPSQEFSDLFAFFHFHFVVYWNSNNKKKRTWHYFTLLRVFHTSISCMVFHWSLSDSKSPQVSVFWPILSLLNFLLYFCFVLQSFSQSFYPRPMVKGK